MAEVERVRTEEEAIEHAVGLGPEAAEDPRALHKVPDPFPLTLAGMLAALGPQAINFGISIGGGEAYLLPNIGARGMTTVPCGATDRFIELGQGLQVRHGGTGGRDHQRHDRTGRGRQPDLDGDARRPAPRPTAPSPPDAASHAPQSREGRTPRHR